MAVENWVITIKNATRQKHSSPIAGNTNSSNTNTEKNIEAEKKMSREDLTGYFAYKRYISPFVKQAISYGISTVSVRTGRTEHQQRLQLAYDVIGKVSGMAENIWLGFALSGGNPVGALVGAAVSTLNTIVGYAQSSNTLDINRNAENISIGLMNVRAAGNVAATSGSRRA
jgi:hypothetical protein|nr:MAG TPA: hypothetical protein [Caudoviricetes sp.]